MATSSIDQGDRAVPQLQLQVRPLQVADLPQALAQSQALQWPYRLEDWQFALQLGHGIAVEQDGQLVGTALWWPYGENFASAGMIIVAASAQRRGIGGALMTELLEQTGRRMVILNSTEEGYALYAKLGFVADGAVHQHQAVLDQVPQVEGDDAIRNFASEDFDALMALDREASGMDRRALIDALIANGTVRVIERDGAMTGFGFGRRWGRGYVIGPVVAPDMSGARALIADLAAPYQGGFVRIDVTLASRLSPWLEEIGLPKVGQVTSMALGTPPRPSKGASIFALSNQSLG